MTSTSLPSSHEASAPSREQEQAEVIRRMEEDIIFGRFAPGSRLVEDTHSVAPSMHAQEQVAAPATPPQVPGVQVDVDAA